MWWNKKEKPQEPAVVKNRLPCEFDIERRRVFSIERDYAKDLTIICFVDDKRENQQYVLPASEHEHLMFVQRMRATLKINQPTQSP